MAKGIQRCSRIRNQLAPATGSAGLFERNDDIGSQNAALSVSHACDGISHIFVGRHRHATTKLAVTGDAAKPEAAARFAVGVMPQQAQQQLLLCCPRLR